MFSLRRALAAVAVSLGLTVLPDSGSAHFQLVYTPEANVSRPGELPLRLVFWHPFDNGTVMDMGVPESFTVLHRGETVDLSDRLKSIQFQGAENTAIAYEAVLPVRRNGDYILAVTPAPYYEATEDKFIQQITKAFVNKGGVPTDWSEPLGLPTEILPLNKPNNIVVGSTFSGIVLAGGKPVAGAEIEIEFMAAEPDLETNKAKEPTASAMPGGALVALSDANGVFTFGIPKAGYWGFAALEVGPETEHEGKPLSQDAVLWIHAYDLK